MTSMCLSYYFVQSWPHTAGQRSVHNCILTADEWRQHRLTAFGIVRPHRQLWWRRWRAGGETVREGGTRRRCLHPCGYWQTIGPGRASLRHPCLTHVAWERRSRAVPSAVGATRHVVDTLRDRMQCRNRELTVCVCIRCCNRICLLARPSGLPT